jgi:hypothetical protein
MSMNVIIELELDHNSGCARHIGQQSRALP